MGELIRSVAILGIGSPFGMDRLGWLVADRLAGLVWDIPGVQLSIARCPSPAHLPALTTNSQALLVIDLVSQLGQDLCLLGPADISEESRFSSHGLNLVDMLRVAATLNPGLSDTAILALGPGGGDEQPEQRACSLGQPAQQAITGWLEQIAVLSLCK